MSPDDQALVDIALRARLIVESTAASSEEAFLRDRMQQDAAMYRLIVMGEAVKRLSGDFRRDHGELNWSDVAGLRDLLVHGYHRISLARVWRIMTDDVPALLDYIQPLLPPEPPP